MDKNERSRKSLCISVYCNDTRIDGAAQESTLVNRLIFLSITFLQLIIFGLWNVIHKQRIKFIEDLKSRQEGMT